jgi:hypothetical protein
MIDPTVSERLHDLAESVDPSFDLAGLRRRIASRARRRQAVKVGVAGAGVAVMVGGLAAVRDRGTGPSSAAAAELASGSGEPVTLEACDVVLSRVRAAMPTPDVAAVKPVEADLPADEGGFDEGGFKGFVTVLSVEGAQLTFRVDEADPSAVTSGAAVVDATTSWVDGGVPLAAPAALAAGQPIGLATTPGADGGDHVLLVDVGASARPADEPVEASKTPPDSPPADVAPGATGKSVATVSSVDARSLTVTLTDESAPTTPVAIDLAGTPFYAGDTQCAPGTLTVGTQLGVGYHLGDDGQVVADIVILMP